MSVELLVFIFVALVLPLIERLLQRQRDRTAGQRRAPKPAPRQPPSPQQGQPGPRPAPQRPAAPAPLPADKPAPVVRIAAPPQRAVTPTQHAPALVHGRRRPIPTLAGPVDPRHAMVLMAIFGPCRGMEPYDASRH
jgi:hypothetical protein